MNIIIRESKLQFRNPQVGRATRAIEEHYNGRRIIADVDGEEQFFRFKKDELAFNVTEEDMELAIEERINSFKECNTK